MTTCDGGQHDLLACGSRSRGPSVTCNTSAMQGFLDSRVLFVTSHLPTVCNVLAHQTNIMPSVSLHC